MNLILPKKNLIIALGLLLLGLFSAPLRADILYVSNIGRSQIGKFTAGGAASAFASSVTGPTALAFDSAGNLYAATTGDNTIAKFTPSGVRSVFASSGISVPKGLAFDSAGNLYVANEATNTIVRFTPGGVGSAFTNTGLNVPRGLAFDSAGNLYVANSGDNSIVKFTPGGVRSVFANSRLNAPVSLAFDTTGNLYVSNRGDDTITKFTPSGVGSLFASGGPNGVFGLAFDSAGNLYASNSNNHTILKFTPGGIGSVFTSDTSFPDGLAFTDDVGVPLTLPPRAPGSAITLTGFTGGFGSGASYVGQSFTVPGSGSFTNISFNFFIGSEIPVASGTAYLLSTAYGGMASALSNATLGYIASATASGGFYHFGNTVTLVGGRQYFLYTDTVFTHTGSSSDDYPGGSFYGSANFSNFVSPFQFVDGNFAVNGAPVASLPRADILYVSALSNSNQVVKVAASGVVTGFASGGFSIPCGVAFDGGGNLYVADIGLDQIVKVTPAGTRSIFASSVGSAHGLAFDAAGNLYVSNFAFDTITKITPAGVKSVFASSGLRRPTGLAFDGAGNLYVANFQGSTITRITPAGVGSVFATDVGSPYGLAFDRAGNLYVANTGGNGSIVRITPAGVNSIFVGAGFPSYLFGLAFDGAGILHVASLQDGIIRRFSPTGVSLGVLATVPGAQYIAFTDSAGVPLPLPPPAVVVPPPPPPPVRGDILYVSNLRNVTIGKFTADGAASVFTSTGLGPFGLAFDSARNLYVANSDGNTIEKITPGGARSIFANSGLNAPIGLAFDTTGNLYVSNFSDNNIVKFTPGGVRSIFASTGLSGPNGLAFDGGGNLYVVSTFDNTIVKFTPSGVRSVFASIGSNRLVGLAFDNAGNLYATSEADNNVMKFTPDGVRSVFASGLNGPRYLAFDGAGNLYVSNAASGTIAKFTPGGIGSVFASGLVGPSGLAFTDNAGVPLPLPPAGTPPPPPPPDPGRIVNMSIRSNAGTGANTLIVGVVIGGAGTIGTKPLLVRGIGPALTGFGVPGALADPTLSVFAGAAVVATNDNWNGDAQVNSIGTSVGAFQLAPLTSRDAALYAPALAARDYTIQITGVGGTTGIALAELYDASTGGFSATTPQLVNVSARTQVGTGADILIAGFNLGGTTSRTVLIRAVGPTLSAFGVPGVLVDPQLALFSGATRLQENNDWGAAANAALITTTTTALSTFALAAGSRDSVILATLPPGSYTAQVSGVAATTGVALVEIYLVP